MQGRRTRTCSRIYVRTRQRSFVGGGFAWWRQCQKIRRKKWGCLWCLPHAVPNEIIPMIYYALADISILRFELEEQISPCALKTNLKKKFKIYNMTSDTSLLRWYFHDSINQTALIKKRRTRNDCRNEGTNKRFVKQEEKTLRNTTQTIRTLCFQDSGRVESDPRASRRYSL